VAGKLENITEGQLVERALRAAMRALPAGWQEMIVSYFIEGNQSSMSNSYLIEEGGAVKEKSLPNVDELDSLLRKLQAFFVEHGRRAFTYCRLHVTAAGQFEVKYGYDKVDWNGLLIPDWNFFPKKK
jgi:hypothetical protein